MVPAIADNTLVKQKTVLWMGTEICPVRCFACFRVHQLGPVSVWGDTETVPEH